jgi:eukaryotic-like serine/threonine-protein kinase
MGHVWLACDEQTGLDVALKIVAREGKAAARAEREARAAAALRHPRCQRIYALARDSDHIYISYEYIPGKTLRQALAAGELDDRAAVEVAAQVLDALAHAHGRGIVHRDVKPSNVLLAESPEIDARLLDFGLAQMAEFDSLTAIGDVPGTLGYISPERLLGKPSTFSADTWAVGVMLWEALAGSHPFREGGMKETSRRIQSGAAPLQDVRPDLSGALCKAIASALALNPARRPEAGELADELRSLGKKRRHSRVEQPAAEGRPRVRRGRSIPGRVLPSAACGLATGWVTATLPFYPTQWPLGIAAVAAGLGLMAPRAGLAFALTAIFFPLANISLGLGILFAALAAGWLGLAWNDARAGLLALAGPLLAPVAGLGLVPFAAQLARGRLRRGVQAGTAVLLAALVAGLGHQRLPFDGSLPPLGLGIAGSSSPGAVAAALWRALLAHPAVLAETAAFAAAAVLLPSVRRRGLWHAALFSAAFLVAIAFLAPAAPLLPLVGAAWVTAAALSLEPRN